MGDHRANIKAEFTIHGKTYKKEWDSRIVFYRKPLPYLV